jgi:tetratricopeptide (TPR) repeat protein
MPCARRWPNTTDACESAALSLVSLADGHLHAGDHARALALCEEAFEDAARARNAYGQALAGTALGRCAFHRGDLPQARVLLEEARAAFQDLQVTPGVAWADLFLALVGAVSARYASSAVVQPAFILADLQDPRTRLSARLGQEALERGLRAGAGLETTDAARRGMAALRVIESACEQQGNSS